MPSRSSKCFLVNFDGTSDEDRSRIVFLCRRNDNKSTNLLSDVPTKFTQTLFDYTLIITLEVKLLEINTRDKEYLQHNLTNG